jgi:hypothetical protein
VAACRRAGGPVLTGVDQEPDRGHRHCRDT